MTRPFDNSIQIDADYQDDARRVTWNFGAYGYAAIFTTGVIVFAIVALFWSTLAPVVFWTATATGLAVTATVAGIGWQRWQRAVEVRVFESTKHKLEMRVYEAKTVVEEQAAAQQVLQTQHLIRRMHLIDFAQGQWVINSDTGELYASPRAGQITAPEPLLLPAPEQRRNVLSRIEVEPCVCFFGIRDSGKTSTAYRWLERRPGRVLVIDPKDKLNLWPANCNVVTKPAQMSQAVDKFVGLMEAQRHASTIRRTPLTLFVDELHWLKQKYAMEFIDDLMSVAMFGREYGFHAAFTTHGKTVKLLDIDAASLLDNFVTVNTRFVNGTRWAVIVNDDDAAEYELPTPAPKPAITVGDLSGVTLPPRQPQMTERERRIMAAHAPGKSLTQIAIDAGLGNGGNQKREISEALARFGKI